MTVIIALKAGGYLQPRGLSLTVEPGIVMAGDTRLSFVGRLPPPPEDTHVKVDSIGDYAIAGYAGNRNIATSALIKLEGVIKATGNYAPLSITLLAQQKLIYEDSRYSYLPLSQRMVQILLGVRDPNSGKFALYEMSTEKNFTPQVRNKLVAIGSHGRYIRKLFRDVRRGAPYPFQGPTVTLKDDSAVLVKLLLDKAIETSRKVEGNKSFIGGRTHLVILHSKGVEAMDPDGHVQLSA